MDWLRDITFGLLCYGYYMWKKYPGEFVTLFVRFVELHKE
jgi:hypothetical protein